MNPYELLQNLKNKNIDISIPIDVKRITKELDIKIEYVTDFEELRQYYCESKNNKFVVYLNKYEVNDIKYENFVLAKCIIKKINYKIKMNESDIDIMALKLLTPIDLFFNEINKYKEYYFDKFLEIPSNDLVIKSISEKFLLPEKIIKERILFVEKNMF